MKLVNKILQRGGRFEGEIGKKEAQIIEKLYGNNGDEEEEAYKPIIFDKKKEENGHIVDTEEIVEESLSIADKEIELIQKALEKHAGKRKYAANELGISERTLYRKIKEYNLQ